MARRKITLAYINREAERKASYKKRKKGLIKKVEELSTLCGIDACAVIYSEFQPQPEVWPSVPEAQRVLARFMELPDMDKTRLMENQNSFTRHRIEKARNKLRRLQRDNKRKQLYIFMFQCIEGTANIEDFDIRDTGEMNLVINEVLRDITERMEQLKTAGEGGESSTSAAAKRAEEVAEPAPSLAEEKENQGFSYWNLLMSPLDGCDDFGWNNEPPMNMSPAAPSNNPNAASGSGQKPPRFN